LRVGRVPQLELHNGKFALTGVMSGVASKLDAAWQRPLRSCVTISAHAGVAYQTLALVLASAHRAGVSRLALQVRKPGPSAELGWLVPAVFVAMPPGPNEVPLPTAGARSWDEFVAAWPGMHEACSRASQSGGCGYVNPSAAQGGTLKIVLRAAGQGANLEFHRAGLSEAQLASEAKQRKSKVAARREDVAQGRVERTDVEKELSDAQPATQAAFQFRGNEAVNAPSPLSATMRPLCGGSACSAVVAADPAVPVARVLALIGAAFPDGSGAPALAFEEPLARK
jgi:hypothetical protein